MNRVFCGLTGLFMIIFGMIVLIFISNIILYIIDGIFMVIGFLVIIACMPGIPGIPITKYANIYKPLFD